MSEYFSVLKYAEFQIWQNAISVLVIAFDSSWDKKCGWQKKQVERKTRQVKGHKLAPMRTIKQRTCFAPGRTIM